MGRIWILFNPRVTISVYNISSQAVHCHVFIMGAQRYMFLSIIYALNDSMERRCLKRELEEMQNGLPNVPWLAMGDLNVIHNISERSDYFLGIPVVSSIQDFQDCSTNIGLVDLQGKRPLYTWSNKRVEEFVAKKLARFMVNDRWLEMYVDIKTKLTSPEFSEHCAGWIKRIEERKQRLGSFKFFDFLTKHKELI